MTDIDQKLEFVATDQTEASSNAPIPSGVNKFWELELDYAFDDSRTINSYLRIGTFEENPALQHDANNDPIPATSASTADNAAFHRGHDLAAMIVDFYDDTRDRGIPGDPFFTDPAERKAQSALLHSKGGWRDHSDGNRVTTTRGDKIEVIRGNYQLVVLGRQDQLPNQSRYEAGGGHFSRDNDNLTPGAIFKISWVQEPFGGTWRVIEETTKGDYRVRYHGDVKEEYFGNTITTIIGSETSNEPITDWQSAPDDSVVTANPTIVERTYAESMTATQGSFKRPIPTINETSYVVNRTEIDYSLERLVDKDYSDGDMTSGSFTSGSITEERRGRYVGHFDGSSKEFWGLQVPAPTDPDAPEGFSHSGLATNFMEIFGGKAESIKTGFFFELLGPLVMETMIGLTLNVTVGQRLEINLGNKKEYGFESTKQYLADTIFSLFESDQELSDDDSILNATL